MHSHLSIKKIRNYSIIAFFIPLLTINACLAIYNILGNSDIYPNYNWDKKKVVYTVDEYDLIGDKLVLIFVSYYKISQNALPEIPC